MPLYTLWREFDPSLDDDAREAIMVRTISAATWFPEVRWIRSYFVDEPGRLNTLCLYEGPTLDRVKQHTVHCRVPFKQIREVEERLPDEVISLVSRPIGAAPDGESDSRDLFMVKRSFPRGISEAELGAAWMRTAQCAAEIPALSWVRTYWDDENKESNCIFLAPDKATIEEHIRRSRVPADTVEQVGLNYPALWAHVYDSLGIPKYWDAVPAPA